MPRNLLTNIMEGPNRVLRYDDDTVVVFGGDPEIVEDPEDFISTIVARMSEVELGLILLSTSPAVRGGWEMLKILGIGEVKRNKLNSFKAALVTEGIMTANRADNLFSRRRND